MSAVEKLWLLPRSADNRLGDGDMKYDYDVLTIGLGPAGMAVAAMASSMDLKIGAIESHRIGGECMNVGCIPSKALLRMAKTRHGVRLLRRMSLTPVPEPQVLNPFEQIQADIKYINDTKTRRMFEKVDLILQQGNAAFVDPHTVQVGHKRLSAKRIFIATGTKPAIPAFPGIEDVEPLTNENLFHLDGMPDSLAIIGGGVIACEMAQAFSRLGSRCTMIVRGSHLLKVDADAIHLLESTLRNEGIEILTDTTVTQVSRQNGKIHISTDKGDEIVAEKLLVATGRTIDLSALALEKAGVKYSERGITVNRYLQTSQKHIFAVGDCNGHVQLSHAAMHQGMVAFVNCLLPHPFKRDFRRYVVPWTLFTEPQISHVGPTESELQAQGIKYEVIKIDYADYGAAIAEGIDRGFVKVLVSLSGRIFAATVVGEGSGDMINEWGLVIQRRIPMSDILFLQHSFPSMGFLNKRVAETWVMNRLRSPLVRSLGRTLYQWSG